ncbi:uncharacterized protein LOC120016510 isoform X1 [Tripterygium wilfordii]|uniref:uncharacterized protein LOC120016510 isoform X1 n=1 Tax=Tripterygium wilfordii TaxID=458696 RepID=UPI0018F7FBF3|nr:uncharacterized protein LOC120016510 isoform X1 [Tripterygium wilfordii]
MSRAGGDDLKRKVFCFPRSPPLTHGQSMEVIGFPLRKNWHLVWYHIDYCAIKIKLVMNTSWQRLGRVTKDLLTDNSKGPGSSRNSAQKENGLDILITISELVAFVD